MIIKDNSKTSSHVSSWAEHGDIVNERGTKQQTRVESNLFSTVLGEKRRTSSLPAQWGIYKRVRCNPTHHKMLLLSQKDNINRSRSRKLSWQFSLLDLFAILPLTNPKVRRATSLLAQDDTLKGLLHEPRTNGRPHGKPTSFLRKHWVRPYGRDKDFLFYRIRKFNLWPIRHWTAEDVGPYKQER